MNAVEVPIYRKLEVILSLLILHSNKLLHQFLATLVSIHYTTALSSGSFLVNLPICLDPCTLPQLVTGVCEISCE